MTITNDSTSTVAFSVGVLQKDVSPSTLRSKSQTLWSHDPFTLLKIIEKPKELLFMWVLSIGIYHIRNSDINLKYLCDSFKN